MSVYIPMCFLNGIFSLHSYLHHDNIGTVYHMLTRAFRMEIFAYDAI